MLIQGEEDYAVNRGKYRDLYGKLADAKSKDVFARLLSFRLTNSLSFLDGFDDLQADQYFEEFLGLAKSGESFVDCGSYDGYTSEQFAIRCPAYQHIYALEPIPENMETVQSRLAAHANITFIPYGAADSSKALRFNASGSASRISDDGELVVNVRALDELVPHGCSFLKMDIEGGEIPAIRGAKALIKDYYPKMAISAYHKVDDFWQIADLVHSLNPNYKVYMRHYTEGLTETVLFFCHS